MFFCEFLFLICSLCLQPTFCSFSSLLLAPSFCLFLSWALSSVLLSLPPPISAVLQIVHCFGSFQSCRVPVFLLFSLASSFIYVAVHESTSQNLRIDAGILNLPHLSCCSTFSLCPRPQPPHTSPSERWESLFGYTVI